MRIAAITTSVLVASAGLSCGPSSPAAGDPSARAPEAADPPNDDAPDPCAEGTIVPTQSPTLDAWPSYDPVAAPRIDARVESVDAQGAPAGVLVAKDGAWVFAALGPAESGQIGVFARKGTSLTYDHGLTTPANALPFGLTQSASGAFVAATVGPNLVLFDVAKAEANESDAILASIPNGSTKGVTIDVKLTPDDKLAFTALENDAGVAVIDIDARKLVGVVPIAGRGITGIAISPDGNRVYVSAQAANEFLAKDPKPDTDQVVGSITVIDAGVARTSPAKSVLGRAFVGRAPVRLALANDGAMLWATLRGSNAVVALATEHLLSTSCTPVRASFAVGPAPVGVTFVAGGTGIAVASSNRFASPSANQTVALVSVKRALARAADPVIGTIGVGAFPRELAEDGDALFVSNFNSKSLSAIDLASVSFE